MQLVLYSLLPDEDIPEEIHLHTTQFIRVEEGEALIKYDNKKTKLTAGDAFIIPYGVTHYIKNIGKIPLKLYSIYTPKEHKEGLVQKRKP